MHNYGQSGGAFSLTSFILSREQRATCNMCSFFSSTFCDLADLSCVLFFSLRTRLPRLAAKMCHSKEKTSQFSCIIELLWCNNPVSRDPRQRERCCASAVIHHWSHKRNHRGKENLWRLVNLIPVGACTVSHHSISCASFCECSLTSSPIVATTYPVSLYIPTVFQYTCAVVCRPALRKSLFVHILCVSVNIFN